MTQEALKLALDGITKVPTLTHGLMVKLVDVEAAIKEAFAQPEPFKPDWDAMAVMVEEQQRMAKRIEELEAQLEQEPVADSAFLERVLAAMEGVIDVAGRKTNEFDALRGCIVDLTLMLHLPRPAPVQQEPEQPPQRKLLTDEKICLIAHNTDPNDWDDLTFKKCWHEGFKAGFREAEIEHNIKG